MHLKYLFLDKQAKETLNVDINLPSSNITLVQDKPHSEFRFQLWLSNTFNLVINQEDYRPVPQTETMAIRVVCK